MDKTLILNQIKKHLKFKTDTEFADFLGVKQPTISTWRKRNTIDYDLIIAKCDNIDANWLMTGKGNMLKSKDREQVVAEPAHTYRRTKDKIHPLQRVPIFNLDATMGLVPMINESGIDEDKILDFISIPDLPACDGATYASGDSMYPLLKAGDLIAYKRIPLDPNMIFYGEIYLLSIKIDDCSTYKTIKFVQKSELGPDYLRLVSQNQHHSPMDIELKQIAAIALVRASIRIHN
ncbi:helix-turn-helix domain-containing protein [Weeksella virosa]|uniref:LexA family transcriptional regulator n=1 Tax=Weeksella virosa TaxID=1014 RepID=UPI0025566354|nr:helix-turn-helix domain-containing protein [Weeksella virosa]MDK7375944.1 helix-turn-helix domain-containing protein [Weeksella virosa]